MDDDGVEVHDDEEFPRRPTFIEAPVGHSISFLQAYGWYLLAVTLVAFYLWNRFIRPKLAQLQQSNEQATAKKYDRDAFTSQQERMMQARLKMQEKYSLSAQQFQQEQQQREEQKRQEKIEDWERHKQGRGYRNKTHFDEDLPSLTKKVEPSEKKPTRLRDDYNPLMGHGGSGYRPSTCKPGARGGG